MKNYCCEKCGSINVFIDDRGTQKALMCGDCGVWLKWIGKKELPLIEKYIKENSDISTKENEFSETLIEKYGWELAIWSVRYGSGFWLMIAPQHYIQDINDITTGADVEAVEFEIYIADKGSWLPIISGDTILDALDLMEKKLVDKMKNDKWFDAVDTALEKIIKENDGSYGLKSAIDNDKDNIFVWND